MQLGLPSCGRQARINRKTRIRTCALSNGFLHSRSVCQSSLRALCLSLSLSISLFLSLCGPQHNISHIVASRVSTTAIVSTHNPLTLPPSWRSSPVGETASQHFCFTHRIVLATWRALLSFSSLSETPKPSRAALIVCLVPAYRYIESCAATSMFDSLHNCLGLLQFVRRQ